MTKILPVVPLRDMVVFPFSMVPLFIGRDKSIKSVESALENKSQIILVSQKEAKENNPPLETLGTVGVLCSIVQTVKFPDSTIKTLVEAKSLVKVVKFADGPFISAQYEVIDQTITESPESRALFKTIKSLFEDLAKIDKSITPEMLTQVGFASNWSQLVYSIAANMSLKLANKIALLETTSPLALMEKLIHLINDELEINRVEKKIQTRIKRSMEKSQKDYYLTEQMEAIQKELGGKDDGAGELEEMLEKAKTRNLSAEALERVTKEIKKIKAMNPMSSESAVSRNYVETILSLPWGTYNKENHDIAHAEEVLNRDHFGLEKVKERILEQLAVMQLNPDAKGTIICLAGPPGVGKTSLAKSVAESQGREFVRISLGGVTDSSELRGHRRTYVGAMPGKIVSAFKRLKSSNPLILLDEIEKMGSDAKGDPASAMLEILDPEQNKGFMDHFLDVEYDLSKVLFFCTANFVEMIPGPLKDRMEIIKLSAYTDLEKQQIATQYIIPRQIKNSGLTAPISFTDSSVSSIIQDYTREAGVRGLERVFGKILRKLAKKSITSKSKVKAFDIDNKAVVKLLGEPRMKPDAINLSDEVGTVNGMAWTESGGCLLPVESIMYPGKGNIQVTGQLGEVMKESAQAALSYVKSRAELFGVGPDMFEKNDMHVHFGDGSTPKDGPSAGLAIVTSMVSLVTRIPVRRDIAMTGEVSLSGKAHAIGGLKEKVIAAQKAGVKTIIMPKDNQKDIKDIPKEVRDQLKFICVSHVDEVLVAALAISKPRDLFKVKSTKLGYKPEHSV